MNRFADKVLSLLVDEKTAAAACPPDPFYQHKCQGKKLMRRLCRTKPTCVGISCGPWSHVGSCA